MENMNMQGFNAELVEKYRELKKEFDSIQESGKLEGKKKLAECAVKIQSLCGLPGDILLSKLYIQWALEFQSHQKAGAGFAIQATQALGLVMRHGYEDERYTKWTSTDSALTIDINAELNQLLTLNLLRPEDLKQQACARRLTYVT